MYGIVDSCDSVKIENPDALILSPRCAMAPLIAFGGLLHDQNQWQAGGEHDGQKKKDVDITHHGGLLLDHAEQSGSGLFGGGGCVHAANRQTTQSDI